MNDSTPLDVTQDVEGNPLPQTDAAPAEHVQRIGRYRIEKVLGKGGFGLVYLAHDEQLDRLVSIKVPHASLISQPEDAEAYLAEARTVANLDHPGIVPVHDVGSTEDYPCYVVSKYVEGTDLSKKIEQQRLQHRDAAELVATVAESLHYAHKQGLVHRDVKPGNILIDGELEVRLIEDHNIAAVDLFPERHAQKVLGAFGRAFGALPDDISETTKEQKVFLKQTVAGLAQEGKVICVRLALFAEMMKSKTWTPAVLKEVGGTKGVGVTFLEETFGSSSASPEHRFHQKAARAVLKDLLPDSGADIKGHMRSYAELLEASGYGSRSEDFDDLIRILDSEIRLITPTDPAGKGSDGDSLTQTQAGQKYFQLTHDYLVHSLRDWLTRKQKETRRGRAELRLSDRAVTWNSKPENRFLPSWWENLNIHLFTEKKKWTEPQRKMMAKAGSVHGLRTTLSVVLLVVVGLVGISIRDSVSESRNVTRAEALVQSLANAEIAQVPDVVAELTEYRKWADPLLKTQVAEAEDNSARKLHLALALLPVDDSQIDYLSEQLPVCTLSQFAVLRTALRPHKDKLLDALWHVALDEQREVSQRFQASAALAEYAPDDERWQPTAALVSQHWTTAVSSVYHDQWLELFRPARDVLTDSLSAIHADRTRSEKQRATSALVLSRYLQDQPNKLVDLILIADELEEFSSLIVALKPHAEAVHQRLLEELQEPLPAELDKPNRFKFKPWELPEKMQRLRDARWKRQSLAAVTLTQLGFEDDVWSLLEFTPNPSLRSFIIHHLGKVGTHHDTLAAQLQRESDVGIRRALVQSLGGLDAALIPPPDRSRIAAQVQALYQNDPDPGTHSSASWTLRQWGISLPEIPASELPPLPAPIGEQKERLAALSARVEEIQRQLVAHEAERPLRQAAWEEQLRASPEALPASLSEGLVTHYRLDETEGTRTANTIADQPHGFYWGPGQPEWVPGILGGAVRLDGEGGRFACGEPFNPERTDSFSYGCWYHQNDPYPGGNGNYNEILLKERGARGIKLGTSNDGIFTSLRHASARKNGIFVFGPNVSFGEWHHLMVTYDGSSTVAGVTFYVDGQVHNKGWSIDRLTKTIQTPGIPFRIHSKVPIVIDDVRIYDRLLGQTEVQQLFQSGLQSLAGVAVEKRTPAQQALLTTAFQAQEEPPLRLQSQLTAARKALLDAPWKGVRRWHINGQGQTMVVITIPSEDSDSRASYSVAISSHEVTVAEFRRFMPKYKAQVASTEKCPAHGISWYQAAEYCNWLSRQEGIPEDQWVYERSEDGWFEAGMSIKENAHELLGYRLPTETEWRIACRAETSGSLSFGEPLVLLENYGPHGRMQPVEQLLPNAYGLFDMHGNVDEWSQNNYQGVTSGIVTNGGTRRLHGGSFIDPLSKIQTDMTSYWAAGTTYFALGFRPLRSLPPSR